MNKMVVVIFLIIKPRNNWYDGCYLLLGKERRRVRGESVREELQALLMKLSLMIELHVGLHLIHALWHLITVEPRIKISLFDPTIFLPTWCQTAKLFTILRAQAEPAFKYLLIEIKIFLRFFIPFDKKCSLKINDLKSIAKFDAVSKLQICMVNMMFF